MSLKVFLPSLLVLALSACAVGPDYKTPTTEAANITSATDGAAAGCLRFARNEIPRLDDDRNYPDRGALALTLTGGK